MRATSNSKAVWATCEHQKLIGTQSSPWGQSSGDREATIYSVTWQKRWPQMEEALVQRSCGWSWRWGWRL